MCPYVQIEPKYTYTTGHKTINMPLTLQSPNTTNLNIWSLYNMSYSAWPTCVMYVAPELTMPSVGLTKSDRVGNKISVTNVRIRMYITMPAELSSPNTGNPFNTTSVSEANPWGSSVCQASVYSIPRRWLKLRLLCVKFDDKLDVTPLHFTQWFYSTFLPFKDYTGSAAEASTKTAQPVSVQSKMLHMVSDYIGQFNILLDKNITLYSSNPSILLDFTLPINSTYTWNEAGNLQSPKNIVVVLMPPLSLETDMDRFTATQYELAGAMRTNLRELYTVYYNCKLNFSDL